MFFFRPSLKQILLFFLTNATASRNALSPRFSLFPRIFAKLGPFPFVHNVYLHFSRSSFEKIFHFKRSLENLKIYNYTMYCFHGLFKRFELFSRGIIRKIWNISKLHLFEMSKFSTRSGGTWLKWWKYIYFFFFFSPLRPSLDKQERRKYRSRCLTQLLEPGLSIRKKKRVPDKKWILITSTIQSSEFFCLLDVHG